MKRMVAVEGAKRKENHAEENLERNVELVRDAVPEEEKDNLILINIIYIKFRCIYILDEKY
ncbi:hypothetical protein N9S60_00405 [bacterium]|nr:hypothetical protein [bacterium]